MTHFYYLLNLLSSISDRRDVASSWITSFLIFFTFLRLFIIGYFGAYGALKFFLSCNFSSKSLQKVSTSLVFNVDGSFHLILKLAKSAG